MKPLTLGQLNEVWQEVRDDPDARGALRRLKRDGFVIAHLEPQDPTFKRPCWADYIAALPFLPNRASRRRVHRRNALRKHLPLVSALVHFAEEFDDPFCEKHIVTTRDTSVEDMRNLGKELRQAAELIRKFLSWDWYTRDRNPRNALIAELRWTIRARTGNPHDRDLSILIDAAFRAAGNKDGMYLDPTALDRIEKREKEGRVKATCRLNYLTGVSPTPKIPKLAYSTSFPSNRGKRVQSVFF